MRFLVGAELGAAFSRLSVCLPGEMGRSSSFRVWLSKEFKNHFFIFLYSSINFNFLRIEKQNKKGKEKKKEGFGVPTIAKVFFMYYFPIGNWQVDRLSLKRDTLKNTHAFSFCVYIFIYIELRNRVHSFKWHLRQLLICKTVTFCRLNRLAWSWREYSLGD